jgi:hypothetical protein
MALDEITAIAIITVVIVVAVVASGTVILTMRRRISKLTSKQVAEPKMDPVLAPSPFRVSKSIQSTDAVQAKDELRMLDLEREILGDAIRRLYEAHAEGKITEREREKLASSYKARMMSVKDSIAKDETIVALHELEGMQEDLMKLFSDRFGELSSKVEELRGRIEVRPIKEVKIPVRKIQVPIIPDQMEREDEEESEGETKTEEKPKKPRKSPAEKQKSEAEMRIDAIRNQIDDVMNKLGQMEMES